MRPVVKFLIFGLIIMSITYFLAKKKNENSAQEIATEENNSPSFKSLNDMITEINTDNQSS